MAHYGDRTDRSPRHVRLLGAQCQRRPGYRDIEQRTDWNYEYNAKLAHTAENNRFEYALSQVRYEASYGAEYQRESTSFSLALLLATQRLKVRAPLQSAGRRRHRAPTRQGLRSIQPRALQC